VRIGGKVSQGKDCRKGVWSNITKVDGGRRSGKISAQDDDPLRGTRKENVNKGVKKRNRIQLDIKGRKIKGTNEIWQVEGGRFEDKRAGLGT